MRRRLAAAVGVALVLSLAADASAVEREHQLGVDLGMPVAIQAGGGGTGASFGLHYTYGLNDALNLMADGGTSLLMLGTGAMSTASNVDVGVGYVLDVLRWVPWGAAELGAYALTGNGDGGVRLLPGGAVSVGLDYRIDRSWAVGFMLREHAVMAQTSPSPSFSSGLFSYPSYTQGLLRLSYTWGW